MVTFIGGIDLLFNSIRMFMCCMLFVAVVIAINGIWQVMEASEMFGKRTNKLNTY